MSQCISYDSLGCFKVLGLNILRSLIHFELILGQGERQRSSFSLLHVDIQFSQQHLLKRLSFLHCMFWIPLLEINWLWMCVWVYVCVFYLNPLVIPFLLWLCSIVWSREFDTSSIELFTQNCFGYSRSFVFPYEFQDFSISVKNIIRILIGTALNI
jgi:hypothetical protein